MITQVTFTDTTSGTTITMPKCKLTDAGELLYAEKTMCSGKLVCDITGFRPGFAAEWDYVPASDLLALMNLIRTCGYIQCSWQDIDGDRSGMYRLSYPQPQMFKFKADGTAVWHNVKITAQAQEVVS